MRCITLNVCVQHRKAFAYVLSFPPSPREKLGQTQKRRRNNIRKGGGERYISDIDVCTRDMNVCVLLLFVQHFWGIG